MNQQAFDWIWYGIDEKEREWVSLGRWQIHPCQLRYKLATIQPVEHDHEPTEGPIEGIGSELLELAERGPEQTVRGALKIVARRNEAIIRRNRELEGIVRAWTSVEKD